MKTKLSFLALALCLGLALTFALAACTGGSGSHEEESSSSRGGNVPMSSDVADAQLIFTVDDPPNDIYANFNSDRIELLGIFSAGNADAMKTLEFIPSGWVKYNGNEVNSKITIPESKNTYLNLSNEDAFVYLDNKNLGNDCGKKEVQVKACLENKDNKERCTSHKYEFNRPESYCATSSAGGASSSSAAAWKFGSKEGPKSAALNSKIEISGFSASFTLTDPDIPGVQANISVSGGNVRYTNVNYTLDGDPDNGFNDYPVPNKSYPSNLFKNMTGAQSSMDIEGLNEYYIITASSGNDKYLVRIEYKTGSSNPTEWPKTIYYWKVLEGPNL
jgi:hypothetical protein